MTTRRSILKLLVFVIALLATATLCDAQQLNPPKVSSSRRRYRPPVQKIEASKEIPNVASIAKAEFEIPTPTKSRSTGPVATKSRAERDMRSKHVVNPIYQIPLGENTPRISRTLYELRNKARYGENQENGAQTLEELLKEIDAKPPKLAQSTPKSVRPPERSNQIQNPTPTQIEWTEPNQIDSSVAIVSLAPTPPEQALDLGSNTNVIEVTESPPVYGTTLQVLEQMAFENHPTLNAALAKILTARHQALQAGLRPNPVLGLFIDEAGNENDPGLWGAYIQRQHIRGNKLALGREIKNREANVLEAKFETQVIKLKTDVRTAYYKLLIAKEKQILTTQLYRAQQDAITNSGELFEAGETPRTDLLQTELQAQKTLILLSQSELARENAWRELAAIIGNPQLPFRDIDGDLNPITEQISFEECLCYILENSPELRTAELESSRVRATIDQELANTIPNYQTQLTVGRDSISNHFYTGIQFQIPLQINNNNQGNIEAAKTKLIAAQNEMERVKLDLTKRLSTEYQQYQSALAKSEMFTTKLLPKAKETLDLLSNGYPDDVSFLQLLIAQQTVIEITLEYLDTLSLVWQSRLKIEGLLLDDSLSK